MKQFVVPVEIEPLEEGGFLATCHLIQGCHAEGETIAQALDNLEDVARVLLELGMEDGLPLPTGLTPTPLERPLKAEIIVTAPQPSATFLEISA